MVNPSARPRGGTVEAVLPGSDAPPGTQVLDEPPGAFGIPRGLGAMSLDAQTVRMLIGLLPSGSQIDAHTWIQDIGVTEDETGIDITIEFGPRRAVRRSDRHDQAGRLHPARSPSRCTRASADRPAGRRKGARSRRTGTGTRLVAGSSPQSPSTRSR